MSQPYVSEFEKNIELSIGEVNGHFYLKIKMKKVRKKKVKKKRKKNRAELLRPEGNGWLIEYVIT